MGLSCFIFCFALISYIEMNVICKRGRTIKRPCTWHVFNKKRQGPAGRSAGPKYVALEVARRLQEHGRI